MEKTKVIALSLGAGYGSVGMALMIEAGLFPDVAKPDLAVFADTQAEPPHVYDTVEWLRDKLSYPVIVATFGDLLSDTWKLIEGKPTVSHPNKPPGAVDLPVYGGETGGLFPRQCTSQYKVRVVNKAIQTFVESPARYLQVTQYVGISLDEAWRVKDAPEKYITKQYPLVDNRIDRAMLVDYLDTQWPRHPVRRSACFFCPFHSIAEWRDIRLRYPELYQEAVTMERALRAMPRGPFYLYSGKYGRGLETAMAAADLQGQLWPESDQFINECEGHCGV